jgi:hypothetical protein
MRMTLFLSIMYKLSETSPYFFERYDATDRAGLLRCKSVLLLYVNYLMAWPQIL